MSDPYEKLEGLPVEAYERALRDVQQKMTPNQRRMLIAHAKSPGASVSMRELAHVAGYPNHGMANIQYGKLGRLIGSGLGTTDVHQQIQNMAIAAQPLAPGAEWHWEMRPQLLQAIRKFGHADERR